MKRDKLKLTFKLLMLVIIVLIGYSSFYTMQLSVYFIIYVTLTLIGIIVLFSVGEEDIPYTGIFWISLLIIFIPTYISLASGSILNLTGHKENNIDHYHEIVLDIDSVIDVESNGQYEVFVNNDDNIKLESNHITIPNRSELSLVDSKDNNVIIEVPIYEKPNEFWVMKNENYFYNDDDYINEINNDILNLSRLSDGHVKYTVNN